MFGSEYKDIKCSLTAIIYSVQNVLEVIYLNRILDLWTSAQSSVLMASLFTNCSAEMNAPRSFAIWGHCRSEPALTSTHYMALIQKLASLHYTQQNSMDSSHLTVTCFFFFSHFWLFWVTHDSIFKPEVVAFYFRCTSGMPYPWHQAHDGFS